MPPRFAFLALLIVASTVDAAEVRTLKGEVISGDLVGVSDKEIVLQKGTEKIATPTAQVVQVDFGTPGRIPADTKFIDVELTDGSVLHCSALVLRNDVVELTLLAGQQLKVSLSAIANILNEAHVEKNRKEWSERLAKKRRRDVLATVRDDNLVALEGTLGAGDDEGKTIEFTLPTGRKANVPLANVQGLIFQRTVDPTAAPVVCKLHDTHKNVLFVSGLATTPTGFAVTTPSGAKIDYTAALLSRLDFSRDKLVFLSDLEPASVSDPGKEEFGRIDSLQRDRTNVELGANRPIQLGGITYAKGLVMRSPCEVEYDLKGEFREFKTIAGIDELAGNPAPGLLRIEGDGKELLALSIKPTDKERIKPVTLNIKDVQKLRIVFKADGSPLAEIVGKHLTLADAKVSK